MMIQRAACLTLAIAGGVTLCHASALAKAVGSIAVERIETRAVASGREVVIHTSHEPTFSVFRLSDPFRVLIDINDARLPNAIDLLPVKDGVLRYVSTNTFADEVSAIVRIEIALEQSPEYHVHADGRSIVVQIDTPAKRANAPTAAAPAAEAQQEEAKTSAPVITDERPAAHSNVSRARLGAVTKRVERNRTSLVGKIQSGTIEKDAIHIERIERPSRLVVDLNGVEIQPKWQKIEINKLGVKRARLGTTESGVRVVFDLVEGKPVPALDVDAIDGRLELSLAQAPKPTMASTPAPEVAVPEAQAAAPAVAGPEAQAAAPAVAVPEAQAAAPKRVPPAQTPVRVPVPMATAPATSDPAPPPNGTAHATSAPTKITDMRFEPKDGFMRLTITLKDDASVVEKDPSSRPDSPVLRLANTELPQSFERTLDVTQVAGDTVQAISSYRDGGDTIISANIGGATEHRHWRKGNRLMWDFRTPNTASVVPVSTHAAESEPTRVLNYPEQATSGYATTALQAATTLPSQQRRYTGRRISLDLKDAEILNVLRLLADVSKLNIVAADDVKGRVTIKLRNVPWDQALDIILRSKQLDKTRSGNVVRVAPVEVLRKEEELRIERQKARVELEPLAVRLIPVSYAVANEVKPQVTALLSQRGKVNIDTRTNVLVVEDIADVLLKVERLVRTLDTQTPQVLIESRIVEANTSFSRELGIQWGGNVSATQQFGTSTGLSFPNNIRISGGSDDQTTVTAGTIAPPQFAVNLPAAVGAGAGGSLGFLFGSAGGAALVTLRLSAAEATGKIKIISAPKIVTLDNKQAKIISGEKIPITVLTANGPSTRFIDANLELGVTPHVTQDGSILLNISAKKNELSNRRDLLGTPGILTKEADTEMLVRDGDTAVLGGIYRRNAQETKNYVPWVGQIPVLGWIFKTTRKTDSREELLIFVSPRIVNRAQALVSAQ